jgi:hypothetical protein
MYLLLILQASLSDLTQSLHLVLLAYHSGSEKILKSLNEMAHSLLKMHPKLLYRIFGLI